MRLRAFRLVAIFGAMPVDAQRVEQNAVTSAGDAFGVAVGGEKIGIYTVSDVRGFNPVDAGNVRIEGLYFDQQDKLTNRLVDGSTVRVGITAQRYPFPAPTGIVDYRLKPVEPKPAVSFEFERAPYGGYATSLETSVPIVGRKLGLTAGASYRRTNQVEGGIGDVFTAAAKLNWSPYTGAEVIAFWSGLATPREDATPTLFPAGDFLPPQIERRRFIGQNWTSKTSGSRGLGGLVKLPLSQYLRIEAGLFRSTRTTDRVFADQLRGVGQDGSVANRVIVADGNNLDVSDSGEVRMTYDRTSGQLRHSLIGSVRGRAKDRDFGGAINLGLGPTRLDMPDPRAAPSYVLGPENHDRVRQITYGIGYTLDWARRGALSVSISKSNYRKTTHFADAARPDVRASDDPWLYSATASVNVVPRLALFGGYVRGLEESLVAPDIAINRSEAPPAILTQQADAGLRFAIKPDLTLVAGVFSVRKPYFAVDPSLRFGQLGDVENRGIEVSIAGKLAPGLSIVAGSALIDPKITGDAVTSGRIGPRPLGSVGRHSVFSLDWRPTHRPAWSFELAVEDFSSRIGNTSNRLVAPARETVGIGARYRFKLGSAKSVLHLQLANAFDEYGWLVSPSGGFTYSAPRSFTAQLLVDL